MLYNKQIERAKDFMLNIYLNSQVKPVVNKDLVIQKPVQLGFSANLKADTVSFRGAESESLNHKDKLTSLIDVVKVPFLMLISFINSLFDTIKSVFSTKEKEPKVDENVIKQDYEKLASNKIFNVLKKALTPDFTNELREETATKLAKEFSYVELTEAYGQAHKLLTEQGHEDNIIDNAHEILKEASFIAQNAYFDSVKDELKQHISVILDKEIEKLPLLDEDKAIVVQAREKMADDQKFFDTIFTTAFIDLKPEDNLAYECLAFINGW